LPKIKDLIEKMPEIDEKMNKVSKELKNLNLEDMKDKLKLV